MSRPTILILTQELDPHADLVVAGLTARDVEVVRFNPAMFPRRARLVARLSAAPWNATLEFEGRTLDLTRVTTIWYRRPQDFDFDADMSGPERKFARAESLMAVGGLLSGLRARWINHPERNIAAAYKPRQLQTASYCGLTVPRTLLTNDPDAARAFFEECSGRMIYKTLSVPTAQVSDDEPTAVIFTSVVKRGDLDELWRVKNVPCQLQELVPRDVELRVIVMGDEVFAAEIRAPDDVLDWRRDYKRLSYAKHELPTEIRQAIKQVCAAYDLSFAAIDMIVTPAGEYVFLEINPNGQWAWLEEPTGLPLLRGMVNLLAEGSPSLTPA